MPSPLTVHQIATLREYMELVEDLMAPDVALWYRGVGDAAHTLRPSLFRHPTCSTGDEFLTLEVKMLQRYRERSVPFSPLNGWRGTDDDWERLFVMQHFGVPTRLLDWTESPYMGLFFAVTSCAFDYNAGTAKQDVAVWAMRPEAWNQQALADVSYDGGVLSIDDNLLSSYEPGPTSRAMRVTPVNMYGLHNSPRIVAQRGVFTIFGKETKPMEQVVIDSGYKPATLVKVVVAADKVGAVRKALFNIGVTDSVVYPDLGGLATELKRFYGYWV